MPDYDIKLLASHYLSLNLALRGYVEGGLLNPGINITIGDDDLILRPGTIGVIEFRTVQNDQGEDVQQQRIIEKKYEDFSGTPLTLFTINKAIYDKLNLFIEFDLTGDNSEYGIYQ